MKRRFYFLILVIGILIVKPVLGFANGEVDYNSDCFKIVEEKEELPPKMITKVKALEFARKFKKDFDNEDIFQTKSKSEDKVLAEKVVHELLDFQGQPIAYLMMIDDGYMVVNGNVNDPGVLEVVEKGDSFKRIQKKLDQKSPLYYIYFHEIFTESEKEAYLKKKGLEAKAVISIPPKVDEKCLENRSMPLRKDCESLGMIVTWNQEKREIGLETELHKAKIIVKDKLFIQDDKVISIPFLKIHNGRTYIDRKTFIKILEQLYFTVEEQDVSE
ncbi:MAG: stalk domain-containing protein [Tissierellia bacterium]|nr:stalk domain-containing protein [Tissierellia bacterium]